MCFDHDIIRFIRNVKQQYQRVDFYNIHKKMIKTPEFHEVSKDFLNTLSENLLKNGRTRNKTNRGNLSFTLNDVTVETLMHDHSHSVSHAETPSPEYSLQTPNNSPLASTKPETQQIINDLIFIYRSLITRSITPSRHLPDQS